MSHFTCHMRIKMESLPVSDNDNNSLNDSLSPEPPDNSLLELLDRVFNEDLLRELIIDFVIHDGIKTSPSEIRSCRLVQKAWLHSTSKCLRKSRKPLFQLYLDESNSIDGTPYVNQHGKMLTHFVNSVTGASRIEKRIPSFSINASKDFFREENHQSFIECLTTCGNSLVELNITFPKDGGSMTFIFPNFTLPILRKFRVFLTSHQLTNLGTSMTLPVGNNVPATYLIQSILKASHELTEFGLPFTSFVNLIPYGFNYLVLPETITALDFTCQMTSKDLQVLLKNNLPKLKRLCLIFSYTPFEDGLIFKILQNVRNTLKMLCMEGITHDGSPTRSTYFRLPHMEKLEVLNFTTMHCELESHLSSVEKNLPNLTEMCLLYQTVSMFRKWTDSSKYESVQDLSVSLVDEHFDDEEENFSLSFNVEMMQCLHKAFSNIVKLNISVCGTEISGLQYLFLELKQLEVLRVEVKRTQEVVNSDHWDALLIGLPVAWATALRTTPNFWDAFDLKKEMLPSIKNLTELRLLELQTKRSPPTMMDVSLISDAVFQFAFMKMTKLKHLIFGGRFLVSLEMRSQWKDQGGLIKYFAEKPQI